MVGKRETRWMEESERIREERGLFFEIIWVNGTHGSMVLALVKLEGEQNKGKYEGEIKAACQLTRRMDCTIYIPKIEQDATKCIPIAILFRYRCARLFDHKSYVYTFEIEVGREGRIFKSVQLSLSNA